MIIHGNEMISEVHHKRIFHILQLVHFVSTFIIFRCRLSQGVVSDRLYAWLLIELIFIRWSSASQSAFR